MKSLNEGANKKELVNKENINLSVKEQCEILGLPRSSYYCKTTNKPNFSDKEEKAMKIIDKTHLKFTSYGARMHKKNLEQYDIYLSRHTVAKLMKHMHIKSTAPQPKTSTPSKKAKRCPYLLRGLPIRYPNQVWATDITYIALGKGHVYLSAVIDLYSRYIVGWKLHDSLEARECIKCMESALYDNGTPSIINSDQGSSYSSIEYCSFLRENGIRQSMDGARRWADNIYIERWFRNLKHDYIYQSEYSNMKDLKELIGEYIYLYNFERLHSSLNYESPAKWYYSGVNVANMPKSKTEARTICYYKEAA